MVDNRFPITQYQSILDNISRYVDLTEAVQERFTSIIRTTKIKKRQFIIQPGFVSDYRNYIVEGAVRVFFPDQTGKEHTLSIGIEDWYFSDFYSHISQTPATFFAEALEDSVIFQLKYDDIENLCRDIHSLSEHFRKITEKAFAYSSLRVISNISKTAEERCFEYIEKYPKITNRVPQYVLASYLGVFAEFLSKIRSRQIRKS